MQHDDDYSIESTLEDKARIKRKVREWDLGHIRILEQRKEEKMEQEQTKSVTIMKYEDRDGKYHFMVKDKFDIADEVERLDTMNKIRDEMLEAGEMKRHLWTKETVLF